jgi:hypothetical protein
MVTEIQRKLKIFGKVKTITKEGRPEYYKELVLHKCVTFNYISELYMHEHYILDTCEIQVFMHKIYSHAALFIIK